MAEREADIQTPEDEIAKAVESVEADTPAPEADSRTPVERVKAGWRGLWQVPVLMVAVAVLVGGVSFAIATRPAPTFDVVLDRSEELIDRGQYQDAIRVLNERVFSFMDTQPDLVPIESARRYHTLVARAIYEGQQELGLDVAENHESVVREYLKGEQAGAVLDPEDVHRLAMTYAARGEHDVALGRARTIPADERGLRADVERRVVTRWMGSAVPREEEAIGLLTGMLADPELKPEDRIWALARRAEVQMEQGFVDEAIAGLLRALPRIDPGEDRAGAALLHMKLAEAYLNVGATREVQTHAYRVLELAEERDPNRASAMLALGRVHEARGELVEARDIYADIDARFGGTPAYGGALLGLGQTLAGLGSIDSSLEMYDRLVNHLSSVPRPVGGPTVDEVTESLLERYLDLVTVHEFDAALRFASLASSLHAPGTEPPDVLRAMADGHRLTAESLAGGSMQTPSNADGPLSTAQLDAMDPSTRTETQRHLMRSGKDFRELAERYVLDDNERYADALWNAATQFDRAGDMRAALEAYHAYADGVPDDPRAAEARFRVGRVHQAMGEYGLAADEYLGLVDELRSGVGRSVGPFGVRSYVPLAQCYLLDTDPENDADARELLEAAISGSVGTSDAPHYREALVELGTLHHRTGEHERAIERFDEALSRYPDDPRADAVMFRLADARRQLADEVEGSLDDPMPDAERRARGGQVVELRRDAIEGFEGVRARLETRDPITLTELERLHLRNSLFYMGDCAFDMGAYDEAITHYDTARERYPDDPASLVAMVQIVNAYVERGDLRRAQTANERARRFYLSLPEDAWDDPNLPMERADWERWLESSAQLYETASGEELPER
ncbi:MAG: hypothetical protein DHS20C14_05480 [Phycisphaeraceae bacterium]|nr:MAG: hypothetical protein DHS20C14_05480 [Phycisphaeraceae bacterium]